MSGTKHLYDTIRPMFGGHLLQSQIDGIETILTAITAAGITDNHKTAYMLATVFHECAKKMQPIAEFGKGAGHDYGKKLKMGTGPGHRVPYTTPDKLYYGRGYVQLTWYENYQSMAHLLHVELLENPELALDPAIAANIMITRFNINTGPWPGSIWGTCIIAILLKKTYNPGDAAFAVKFKIVHTLYRITLGANSQPPETAALVMGLRPGQYFERSRPHLLIRTDDQVGNRFAPGDGSCQGIGISGLRCPTLANLLQYRTEFRFIPRAGVHENGLFNFLVVFHKAKVIALVHKKVQVVEDFKIFTPLAASQHLHQNVWLSLTT
jgi:hypothetical protein